MNGAQKVADQVVASIGNDWHFLRSDFNADGRRQSCGATTMARSRSGK